MPKAAQSGQAEQGLDLCSPHPHLLPRSSTHCEPKWKGAKHKPDNAEQKRNKEAVGAEKSRMKMDNCCSVDSADIEGDVARDGLRPGRLCVSTGMGPRRDDHHPIAGPPGHGRLCKSASLSSDLLPFRNIKLYVEVHIYTSPWLLPQWTNHML